MEKYGVNTNDKTKTASSVHLCPSCGKKIEKHGEVLKCTKCGTKPFEKK